jgi:hypothetical protein
LRCRSEDEWIHGLIWEKKRSKKETNKQTNLDSRDDWSWEEL